MARPLTAGPTVSGRRSRSSFINGSWTETILYNFSGTDGANPHTNVLIGSGGVLYGTTYNGGTSNKGTVFTLTPPTTTGGPWTEAVLHSFTGSDGSNPHAPVVMDSNGVLYGTTLGGEAPTTVRSIRWRLPQAQVVRGLWPLFTTLPDLRATGRVCAAVWCSTQAECSMALPLTGGTLSHGIAYSLAPPASPGGVWTETILHNFTGTDGANPYATLVVDSNGLLYGTTYSGGSANVGTVFTLTP